MYFVLADSDWELLKEDGEADVQTYKLQLGRRIGIKLISLIRSG